MRKFVNFSIFAFVVSGIVLIVTPADILHTFYMPWIMGMFALVSAVIILMPRIIFRKPKSEEKGRALDLFQFTITVALILNGLGSLGLYRLQLTGFQYDKFLHFIIPLLFVIWGVQFVKVWFDLKPGKALVIVGVLVFWGGILWELFEALVDKFLGTAFLLGGGTRGVAFEIMFDVVMNTLGIIVGIAFIFWRKRVAKK